MTQSFAIQATDPEEDNLEYQLASGSEVFAIDRGTGVVSTAQRLDREREHSFSLLIEAVDPRSSKVSRTWSSWTTDKFAIHVLFRFL